MKMSTNRYKISKRTSELRKSARLSQELVRDHDRVCETCRKQLASADTEDYVYCPKGKELRHDADVEITRFVRSLKADNS